MKNNAQENKNRAIFEEYSVPRALSELALPMIFGQLIILIYNLADTFYIGRANNPLMVAGVSLILPVFNISISLANLFGIGGGTLISRLLGIGKTSHAEKVSAYSFYMSAAGATLFALSMGIFMNPALRILGASDETLIYARQYTFCVIVLGAVPTILSMTLSNLLRSTGFAKESGFGVMMGGILNMLLDPLFMFVLLPKGFETMGAGIATMLSNVAACLYFLITLNKLGKSSSLSVSIFKGLPEREEIKSIFFVGIPAAISVFLFDMAYIVIDKLAAGYGDIPLAAVGIVLKAERLPLCIGIGICQGMMPLAAYNYASKNFSRMREVVKFSRLVGILIGIGSVIFYEIFAPYIMRIFIENPETVRIGTNFLRIRAIATPLMFLCFHPVNFFQAVGHGGKALFLGVSRWALFNIPMLFIFNAIFGMYGIVWTQSIADLFTVALSAYVYKKFVESHAALI